MPVFMKNGAVLNDFRRLAKNFHGSSVWREVPLDLEALEQFVFADVSGNVFLSLRPGAMIIGVLSSFWFSPSTLLGQELAWYAEDGTGVDVHRDFEEWLAERGVALVGLSCMANGREAATRRLLQRIGYQAVDVNFRKVL